VDDKTRNAKTVVSVGLSFIRENGGKEAEEERTTRGLGLGLGFRFRV